MNLLGRAYRWWAFDWDGTAVATRRSECSRVVAALRTHLAQGARVSIVTGTKLEHVLAQLGEVPRLGWGRLMVSTNRGSEVWGFDRRGRPSLHWARVATAAEEAQLDAAAEALVARLESQTGLNFALEYDRLNRRKVDLIPEPAWADPPKSRLAELVQATQTRLERAGHRGGLGEVVRWAAELATQQGLVTPKITTDGKHVEIGLTDKGDALEVLWAEVAQPLAIDPSEVLLLGDEFGSLAGVPGSDARMLQVPALHGASVISVGPEPLGVPVGVRVLGGGPERFLALLEEQIERVRTAGPRVPPLDPSWSLEARGYDPALEPALEARFALSNGFVGSRAALAEGTRSSRPLTLLAGAFETSADVARIPELLVLPEWNRLRVDLGGHPLNVEDGGFCSHRRVLDLRRALFLREGLVGIGESPCARLRSLQGASAHDRHLLLSSVELEAFGASLHVGLEVSIVGDPRSASGAQHWRSAEVARPPGAPLFRGRTVSGLEAILSPLSRVDGRLQSIASKSPSSGDAVNETPPRLSERFEGVIHPGEACSLERLVVVHTSREATDPVRLGLAKREALYAQAQPFQAELQAHVEAWSRRWRRAAIELDGLPRLERALRFASYHLIASANPDDPRVSVGARGLTGETYRGHVFWDTETFVSPFHRWTWPEAARAQLLYRHRTLAGARRKARDLGYEGALYAWESADTGEEATPSYVVTPFGELLRVLSGDEEHHISADVAQALWSYVLTTGDEALLDEGGLEILLETARFWASRVTWREGVAHIAGVIGPDEYHEGVEDNAFTNWMARHNLRVAVEAAKRAASSTHLVRAGELARFAHTADRLALGMDPTSGLIEQFSGYHQLEFIDLQTLEPRDAPADVVLGRGRTQASQVVKQADVVQLLALLWDEVPAEVRARNYLYYEARTAHGSSLSPGVHAWVAAKLGLRDQASRYLEETVRIDLDDSFGNAGGGVHLASLGALWQAVVFGLAGVCPSPTDERVLCFEPCFLPDLRALRVPLLFRGASLQVQLEPRVFEVEVGEGKPVLLGQPGQGSDAAALAHPGSVHRLDLGAAGEPRWEQVRRAA